MTSSGSGSQFLLRRGRREDSEGEGRKRGVFDARRGGTSDDERREVPACSGSFCYVAYCMRTCKKGIEKHTRIRGSHRGSDLHARRQGRPDSATWRMYTHIGERWLGHTSIGPWSRSRSGPSVRISMSLPGAGSASSSSSRPNDAWLPLSAVLIAVICADSLRGFDVDSLDGTAKGDGETDDDADATGCGVGEQVLWTSLGERRKASSTRNPGIR